MDKLKSIMRYNTDHFIKSIGSYFNFALSIDCIVFGFDENELKVLLIRSKMKPYEGKWSLIGDMLTTDEGLDEAAQRILTYRTGLSDMFLKQFKTFGDVSRHPMGRVITIGYYALIKIQDYQLQEESLKNEAHWHSISNIPDLAFDHNTILRSAIKVLQKKIREEPIGFALLPKKFTLRELQKLYESILDHPIDKRNFRKKILNMDLLTDLDEYQSDVPHRPGKLYAFDLDKYLELKQNGWVFELINGYKATI